MKNNAYSVHPTPPLKLSSQKHTIVYFRIARKQESKELVDLAFSMPDMQDSRLFHQLSLLPLELMDLV